MCAQLLGIIYQFLPTHHQTVSFEPQVLHPVSTRSVTPQGQRPPVAPPLHKARSFLGGLLKGHLGG